MRHENHGGERKSLSRYSRLIILGIALVIGLLAGGLVWGLSGTPALFGSFLISFPFAVAIAFLMGRSGDILERKMRVRGFVAIVGRFVAAVAAIGFSLLFLHLTHADYLYLLTAPTTLLAGYLAGILGASEEVRASES